MPYTGTKYDTTVCSTVKCNHGRDVHAANPRNASEPRHCTTPGCRCGAFRPTPIRPARPQPEPNPQVVTRLEDSRIRDRNRNKDRYVRHIPVGQRRPA